MTRERNRATAEETSQHIEAAHAFRNQEADPYHLCADSLQLSTLDQQGTRTLRLLDRNGEDQRQGAHAYLSQSGLTTPPLLSGSRRPSGSKPKSAGRLPSRYARDWLVGKNRLSFDRST